MYLGGEPRLDRTARLESSICLGLFQAGTDLRSRTNSGRGRSSDISSGDKFWPPAGIAEAVLAKWFAAKGLAVNHWQ